MRTLTRHSDWRLRLDSFLFSRGVTPFEWGHHDCSIFAADCVLEMTGVDLAEGLRGQNARRAARTVSSLGGLGQITAQALGPPQAVSEAREGDVVLMPAGKRVGLSVLISPVWSVGAAKVGLSWMNSKSAICSWRVG